MYCKVPKFSDATKLCCKLPKIQTKRPNLKVFPQKDANGTATVFAQTFLSENLGSLRVCFNETNGKLSFNYHQIHSSSCYLLFVMILFSHIILDLY